MNETSRAVTPSRAMTYVVLLSALLALNLMDRQVLAVIAEPVKKEFGLTDTELGMLTGLIFAVVFSAAAFPVALIADRANRVWVLSLCATLWSMCTVLLGAAAGFQQIAVARIGLALGESGCVPCAQSLVADYVPPERRARAMAILAMGAPAGLVIAGVAGGILNDAFGWRVTLYALGGLSLAVALLGAWVLPEPARRTAGSGDMVPADDGGFRALARKPAFRNLLVASAFYGIAVYGGLAWGTVFVVRYFGWTPGQAGAVLAPLGTVIGLSATWFGGWLTDRLKSRDVRWQMRVPSLALFIAGPATIVAAVSVSIPVLLVAASIEGTMRSMVLAPHAATLQGLAPNSTRARAAAVSSIVTVLAGMGLGPVIVGVLSDRLADYAGADSLRYGLLALAVPQALSALFYWRGSRTLATDLID